MKAVNKIKLKHGLAIFDSENTEKILAVQWHSIRSSDGKRIYAAGRVAGRTVYMHQLVLDCASDVDHKNGNGLDNRRSNLRQASRSQNMANRDKPRIRSRCGHKVSKFKGVSWAKQSNRWQVHIMKNYKSKNLGLFDSEIEAAKAYDEAALELFGEYAKTNFKVVS